MTTTTETAATETPTPYYFIAVAWAPVALTGKFQGTKLIYKVCRATDTDSAVLISTHARRELAEKRLSLLNSQVVFTDIKGRKVNAKVTKRWHAGEITTTAQVQIQIVGTQYCYPCGARFTVDASMVALAF